MTRFLLLISQNNCFLQDTDSPTAEMTFAPRWIVDIPLAG